MVTATRSGPAEVTIVCAPAGTPARASRRGRRRTGAHRLQPVAQGRAAVGGDGHLPQGHAVAGRERRLRAAPQSLRRDLRLEGDRRRPVVGHDDLIIGGGGGPGERRLRDSGRPAPSPSAISTSSPTAWSRSTASPTRKGGAGAAVEQHQPARGQRQAEPLLMRLRVTSSRWAGTAHRAGVADRSARGRGCGPGRRAAAAGRPASGCARRR